MSGAPVARVLQDALTILQHDAPAAFYRVVRELAGSTVDIVVDDEMFHVRGNADALIVAEHLSGAPAVVTTHVDAILDLIDGKTTYLDAFRCGRLALKGNVQMMLSIARAATAFAEGAVRSPRIKGPLLALRTSDQRGAVTVTMLGFSVDA
jgi:hypothetical protein